MSGNAPLTKAWSVPHTPHADTAMRTWSRGGRPCFDVDECQRFAGGPGRELPDGLAYASSCLSSWAIETYVSVKPLS